MKIALSFAVALAVVMISVDCTSPVKCTGECDKDGCPSTEGCRCGSYLDQCQCCSFCLKCANEDCSFIANERCADGYRCQHTEKRTGPDHFNKPGKCLKIGE